MKVKNIKKTPAIPNLASIKQKIEEKENTPDNKEPEKEEREPFDFDTFKKVWNEFAEQIKENGKDSDYNSLKGELELISDEQIKLTIANKFQKVAIENLKQDLLTHIRTRLKNNYITLEIAIRKIEEKELRYTNREKFDYLANKYPKLKEFQSRLDLDPDF